MKLFYEEAASFLEYDKETGEFTWTLSSPKANLRGKHAGSKYPDGYIYIRFKGKRLLAHRLAWVKTHGKLPEDQTDHINMIRSDNRICNLREASITDNNRNRMVQSNNTTGSKGVTFSKVSGKWQAKICVNKVSISLGYFNSVESASIAYKNAALEHHGEFARF